LLVSARGGRCAIGAKAARTLAQLHALIGEMMQGVDIMRGKDPQARREQGAEKIVTALNTYPMHFNHPGWKPLR
jgi:hypothetical protein